MDNAFHNLLFFEYMLGMANVPSHKERAQDHKKEENT